MNEKKAKVTFNYFIIFYFQVIVRRIKAKGKGGGKKIILIQIRIIEIIVSMKKEDLKDKTNTLNILIN